MSVEDLHATTDARTWAREWCRIAQEIDTAADGRQVIDEGWMITWFANAIETGRSAGQALTPASLVELLVWCLQHFRHADVANAAIHCAPVRYSPITMRLAVALDDHGLDPDDLEDLAEVLADRGRYELDPGR